MKNDKKTTDKHEKEGTGHVAIVKNPQKEREIKNAKRNRKNLDPTEKIITGNTNLDL
jgi:hypothetical protein